jgi:hypothetical protein
MLWISSLKHDHSNATFADWFGFLCGRVSATQDGRCPIIEQIIVQLTIASAKLLIFEEEWVIKKRETIDNIEVLLVTNTVSRM